MGSRRFQVFAMVIPAMITMMTGLLICVPNTSEGFKNIILGFTFLSMIWTGSGLLSMMSSLKERFWYVQYDKLVELTEAADKDYKTWKRWLQIIGKHEAIRLLKEAGEVKEEENGSS